MRRAPPTNATPPAYPTASGIARAVVIAAVLSAPAAATAADVAPSCPVTGDVAIVIRRVVAGTIAGWDATTRVMAVTDAAGAATSYVIPAGASIAADGAPGSETAFTAGRTVRLTTSDSTVIVVEVDPKPVQPEPVQPQAVAPGAMPPPPPR